MREFMTVTKALADESRVKTLLALREGERCVCEIVDILGLAPSTVSKHMAILKNARLVESRKEGRWIHYRLSDETPLVQSALAWLDQCCGGESCCAAEPANGGATESEPVPRPICDEPVEESSATDRIGVLFLCTGNSCRSQMAEGWARALKRDLIAAYSAGTEPHGLNPLAVRVMAEAGVDIGEHASQHLDEFLGTSLDYVVTVCDNAQENCPVFPGKVKVIHCPFDDPPRLAKDAASEEEALSHYRRVRDEIRTFVETLPESLP